MRVLVTGGSGFIGRHVCDELRRRGATPLVFDRRAPPAGPDALDFIEGDVLDAARVAKAMEAADAVIHLASLLSVEATERRPRDTLDVALLGTRNVVTAARPGQRVVLASTSEVYGDASVVPTPESCPPSPKSVYGVAKLACEAYVRTAPSFTVLRYFSVYGPGQAPSFVIPRFARQALAGEPLTVYGDGAQVRAFTHVEDAARGTVAALLEPKAEARTYNIGNPAEPTTMEDLAHRIVSAAGSASRIVCVPFSQSDRSAEREIYRRIPSIHAATRDLQYEPSLNLDEGIASVIAALRNGGEE